MKTPIAKIQKAHVLTDQLLAIWQTDIRPWHREDGETNPDGPTTDQIDDAIVGALTVCRELRVMVEATR